MIIVQLRTRLLKVVKEVVYNRALRQTIFVYSGSLINGGSLILLNAVIARRVSTDMLGIFSLAVLVLSTIAEMSDFGLNAGLLRFGPYYIATNQEDKLRQLVKIIWRWRASLSIIFTIGLAILSYPLAHFLFKQDVTTPYLLYSAFGIGGVILLGLLATYLQARQRFVYQAAVQSLKGLLRLSIGIILALNGVRNIYAYLSVYIFVPWLLFLVNFHVFPKNFRRHVVGDEVKGKVHSQLARFSLWLTVSLITSIIASRVDQVIISQYLGLAEVAIFTVSWQLLQMFPLIYSSISSVLIPKMSGQQSKENIIVLVKKSLQWIAIGSVGIGLLIYPSRYLIILLFTRNYAAAMPLYLVFAYGMLLNIMATPFGMIITLFNRTYLMAISGVLMLFVNLIGNIVFIRTYGIMGAAYTFVLSIVIQIIWNSVWAYYLLKYKEIVVE